LSTLYNAHMVDFIKKNAWVIKLFLILGVLLALILSFESLVSNDFLREVITEYHYFGVMVVAFVTGIAGFPVPIVAFTPLFTELGLSIFTVVAAIVIGLTLGDLVTYGFGVIGRKLSRGSKNKTLARLEGYAEKNKVLPLVALFFWASFVPMPNEILLLPLGLLGYRLIHILPPLILGNIVLNTIIASGIIGIFDVFI